MKTVRRACKPRTWCVLATAFALVSVSPLLNADGTDDALPQAPTELLDGAIQHLDRAIAIDDAGNTSEFSPALEFGVIDDTILTDGFEGDSCRTICPI